jgi:hypothetical protein
LTPADVLPKELRQLAALLRKKDDFQGIGALPRDERRAKAKTAAVMSYRSNCREQTAPVTSPRSQSESLSKRAA